MLDGSRVRRYLKSGTAGLIVTVVLISVACGSGDDSPTSTAPVGAGSTPTRQPGSTVGSVQPGATSTTGAPGTPDAQFTPVLTLGRELLVDGSFEKVAFEHWEPRIQSGQFIEISTTTSVTGERSLHMTAPLSQENPPRVMMRERFPSQAGTSIRYAYSAVQSNNGWAELLIDYYDGNDQFVVRTSIGRSDSSSGGWLHHETILEIPDRVATAQMIIRLQDQPGAGSSSTELPEVFVDDVSVKQVLESS